MKAKNQYLLFFYWVALLADAYQIYDGDISQRWITKGLLMPLLALFYFANSSRRHHLPSRVLTYTALALAWAGDLILLKENDSSFMIGLGLFLVMHLVYVIYFNRVHRLFPLKDPGYVVLPVALMAIVGVVVLKLLLPEIGDLKIPIIAYMCVLTLMFVSASNVLGSKKTGSLAAQYFIPGAVLFVASDAMLALNKFIWQEEVVNLAVILTYGYAQQLMVQGFVKHVKGRA